MPIDSATFERMRADLQDPHVRATCERILNYLNETETSKLRHLTYSHFYRFAPNKEVAAQSIHYLAGIISVLTINFEYITQEDDIFEVSTEDIREQELTQQFYDPQGNSIDRAEFYLRLHPYFTLSKVRE